ncbi:helix-turn-helix domain-containing protein [Acinetobacter sp. YIM 103518]|uniref:Helix-turn-helix domain-containing protein n=1 Tax=Acinetobacter faecalis TaxID=2665161 RepID=A0A6L6GGP4_9GAMM|nr:helix-turn-helix transcriptional regulator [Acinetobacter faecalis]MTD11657.1 helix-turn-helix domain-containing protein [Acinetobacter faecalis]
MNKSLLQQIKKRRTQLGLKQVDMQFRTGISRQQYQKLESQGNPRLETLEIIAAGLNAQLMLIPDDKVHLIRQLLNDEIKVTIEDQDDLINNPWKGLLGGEEP